MTATCLTNWWLSLAQLSCNLFRLKLFFFVKEKNFWVQNIFWLTKYFWDQDFRGQKLFGVGSNKFLSYTHHTHHLSF